MAFEDTILLKLKRKYSKDEEMAFLVQKMKEIELENGMLKSEVAEVRYELKLAKNSIEQGQKHIDTLKKQKKALERKHSMLCQETLEKETIIELKKEIVKLRKGRKEEINRFITTKVQYDKLLEKLENNQIDVNKL